MGLTFQTKSKTDLNLDGACVGPGHDVPDAAAVLLLRLPQARDQLRRRRAGQHGRRRLLRLARGRRRRRRLRGRHRTRRSAPLAVLLSNSLFCFLKFSEGRQEMENEMWTDKPTKQAILR